MILRQFKKNILREKYYKVIRKLVVYNNLCVFVSFCLDVIIDNPANVIAVFVAVLFGWVEANAM